MHFRIAFHGLNLATKAWGEFAIVAAMHSVNDSHATVRAAGYDAVSCVRSKRIG
jgi:hypothetical protein